MQVAKTNMHHATVLIIRYTSSWCVIYVTCHKISTVLHSAAVTQNPQK